MIMKNKTKDGYIASGMVGFIGILLTIQGFNQPITSTNYSLWLGIIADVLCMLGVIKPDSVGSVLDHFIKQRSSDTQTMENSSRSVQQKAGRDNIIKKIDNRTQNYYGTKGNSSRKDIRKTRIEQALLDTRSKMIKALIIINDIANFGIKNADEMNKVSASVNDFKYTKMQNEIHFDADIKEAMNDVLKAFNTTTIELMNHFATPNASRSYYSFGFVDKVNKADELISKKLYPN